MGQEQSQTYGQDYEKLMENHVIEKQNITDKNYNGKIDLLMHKQSKQVIVLKEVLIVNSLQKNKSLEHFEKRKKIKHSNLVNFYGLTNMSKLQNFSCQEQSEICGSGNKNYLQIEYLQNTLEDDIIKRANQQQFYKEQELWVFLQNTINVLAYMQDLQLQHADIRPQKIFIQKNQDSSTNQIYKIAEKGLITSQTSFSLILGQQQELCVDSQKQQDLKNIYLSPQLVQSLIVHDWIPNQNQHKSDVFSLGMTVLHMINLKSMDDVYDYAENQMEKAKINQYLENIKNQFSENFYLILQKMLLYSEAQRPDFKQLIQQFQTDFDKQVGDNNQQKQQYYQTTQKFGIANFSPKSNITSDGKHSKQYQYMYQRSNNQSPENSTKPHSHNLSRNSTIQQNKNIKNGSNQKQNNFQIPQNMYFSPPKTKNQDSIYTNINKNLNFDNNSVKKYNYNYTGNNNYNNNEQLKFRQNKSLEKAKSQNEIMEKAKYGNSARKIESNNNISNKQSTSINSKQNSSTNISRQQFSPSKIFQNSNAIIKSNSNLSRANSNISSNRNINITQNQNLSNKIKNDDAWQFKFNKQKSNNDINKQSNENETEISKQNDFMDLSSNFTPAKKQYSQEQLEEQELRRQIQEMYLEQQENKNGQNKNGSDSLFSTTRNLGNNQNNSSIVHIYNQAQLKINSGSRRVSIKQINFKNNKDKNTNKNNIVQNNYYNNNSGSSSPAVKFKNQKLQQQNQNIEKQYIKQNFPNGSKYEGEISNDMRNGQGKFYFSDGGLYIGEWKDNQMHGTGTLYYKNGKKAYEGEWQYDMFNGNATLWNENPEEITGGFNFKNFEEVENKWLKYQGDFKLDTKNGMGILYLTNNDRFHGNFIQDCIEGFGTYYFAKGGSVQGIWKNNIFQQVQIQQQQQKQQIQQQLTYNNQNSNQNNNGQQQNQYYSNQINNNINKNKTNIINNNQQNYQNINYSQNNVKIQK